MSFGFKLANAHNTNRATGNFQCIIDIKCIDLHSKGSASYVSLGFTCSAPKVSGDFAERFEGGSRSIPSELSTFLNLETRHGLFRQTISTFETIGTHWNVWNWLLLGRRCSGRAIVLMPRATANRLRWSSATNRTFGKHLDY